jgi:hypothetical protein
MTSSQRGQNERTHSFVRADSFVRAENGGDVAGDFMVGTPWLDPIPTRI